MSAGDPHGPRGPGDPNAWANQRAFGEAMGGGRDRGAALGRPDYRSGIGLRRYAWGCGSAATGVVVLAVLAVGALALFAAPDSDGGGGGVLRTSWQGAYACADGTRGMTIDLAMTESGGAGRADVEAVVGYFDAPPSGDGALDGEQPLGRSTLTGTAVDGTVTLEGPGSEAAEGFEAAAITATMTLSSSPATLRGTADASSCSEITLVER